MENASHFLFIIPKFNVIRRELLHKLGIMLNIRKLFLFGDDSLPDKSNEVIFRAVDKHIQQTKRFSTNDYDFWILAQKRYITVINNCIC